MGNKESGEERRNRREYERLVQEGIITPDGTLVPGATDPETGIGSAGGNPLGLGDFFNDAADNAYDQTYGQIFNIEFPEIEFPDFSQNLEIQRDQMQRQSDFNLIDQLWAERYNAVNSAISETDRRIAEEQDRADLLGRDYGVTDEERHHRVNLLFSDIWTESNENRLQSLVERFGNPEQDYITRSHIELGLEEYSYEHDVVRAQSTDMVPRREREEQVGDSIFSPRAGIDVDIDLPSDFPRDPGTNPINPDDLVF